MQHGLRPISVNCQCFWSGRPGSNRRHSAWESVYIIYYQSLTETTKCQNRRKWTQRNSYSGDKRGVSASGYAGFSLFLRHPVFNPIGTQRGRKDFWRPHCPAWKAERISLELPLLRPADGLHRVAPCGAYAGSTSARQCRAAFPHRIE
jgi:hypothetical protein